MSHPIQPVGEHFSRRNRRRLADEDKESGLESIFGIMVTAETASADRSRDAAPFMKLLNGSSRALIFSSQ